MRLQPTDRLIVQLTPFHWVRAGQCANYGTQLRCWHPVPLLRRIPVDEWILDKFQHPIPIHFAGTDMQCPLAPPRLVVRTAHESAAAKPLVVFAEARSQRLRLAF